MPASKRPRRRRRDVTGDRSGGPGLEPRLGDRRGRQRSLPPASPRARSISGPWTRYHASRRLLSWRRWWFRPGDGQGSACPWATARHVADDLGFATPQTHALEQVAHDELGGAWRHLAAMKCLEREEQRAQQLHALLARWRGALHLRPISPKRHSCEVTRRAPRQRRYRPGPPASPRVPPPGPAMPVTATANCARECCSAPSRHGAATAFRHRAMLARSRPPARPASLPWLHWNR